MWYGVQPALAGFRGIWPTGRRHARVGCNSRAFPYDTVRAVEWAIRAWRTSARCVCAKDAMRTTLRVLYPPESVCMELLPGKLPDDPNEVRMTIGEHLDELRAVVIRGLVALVIVGIACVWPMKYLLGIIARPLLLAQAKHHQPTNFLITNPAETLLIFIKVVLISALIIASPYIIYQIWTYVASGLYRHERAWVQKLVPFSVGLFVIGVLFMYFVMLPICLDFLIGFSAWLPMPELTPMPWERAFVTHHQPETQPAATQPAIPPVPLLSNDPARPDTGEMWFNLDESKLKLHGVDKTYSLQFQ